MVEHGATKLAEAGTRATPGAYCYCRRHIEHGIYPGRCLRTEEQAWWGQLESRERRSSVCKGYALRLFPEPLVKVRER